jgi:hypothetical protein
MLKYVEFVRPQQPKRAQRTLSTFSISSPRFTFKIKWASSKVIRCTLVSLSVTDPEVAFPTPATSFPKSPCGLCFASKFRKVSNSAFCDNSSVNVGYFSLLVVQPQGMPCPKSGCR